MKRGISLVLKVKVHRELKDELNNAISAKVQFFRIDPEDISKTLSDILCIIMDLSWLSKFDNQYERKAFKCRAKKND